MKLIIAGGRDYHLTQADKRQLDTIPGVTEVVSGCATGADTDGIKWAESRAIPVVRFPADWDTHGKKAGPIRNAEMARYGEALAVFPGGNGTADMRNRAIAAGLKIYDFSQCENTFGL